jgi:hypothetical protein
MIWRFSSTGYLFQIKNKTKITNKLLILLFFLKIKKSSTWTLSLVIMGWDFLKTYQKKYISIKGVGGVKLTKLSFILSFPFPERLLSASNAATYIFTAPISTTTIIRLNLCIKCTTLFNGCAFKPCTLYFENPTRVRGFTAPESQC